MMWFLTALLFLGIIRGIIGTYLNWQIRRILDLDASEKGLRITHVTSAEYKPIKKSLHEKEYSKTVGCVDVTSGMRKLFLVKITINSDRQASLEWTEIHP